MFEPKIDVTQIFISGFMVWTAIQEKNTMSILWLVDFVYHVLEMVPDSLWKSEALKSEGWWYGVTSSDENFL